jgi:hypothetical protein
MKKSHPQRQCGRYASYRDLAIVYEGHSQELPVRVPDISTRGMFINTGRRFLPGAVLKVRFRLCRSQAEIHARAEVRYCLPGVGIGVEFIDISPEATAAIADELAAVSIA